MNENTAINSRVSRIQTDLQAKNIDALVCLKPENSFYLSGFNPIIYSHPVVAVLPANGPLILLVHALRDDHIRASSSVEEIRLYGSWSTKVTMGPNWLTALKQIADELGISKARIGIEEDHLPVGRLREFQELLPSASFVDGSDVIKRSRFIKEPQEVEAMRCAAKLADAGMETAISAIAGGANEREISIAAMATMNRLWASDYPQYEVCDFGSLEGGAHNGLWCWTLVGDRILLNTDNPTLRRAKSGEMVMSLIWTNCDGIHAENERVVAVGELPLEQRRAYDAVLTIRERTKHLLAPGVPIRDLFQAAKAEYVSLGYEANIPGRIGHGIGLGAHEGPSLDGDSTLSLEPNMTITFEPNLRLAEWGGLQHSDTVLITEDGCEFLTRTDNGFLQV